MERILLRPAEAAEMLGIGRSTVYELIAVGDLPVVRIGQSVRISAEVLREWAQARPRGQPARDFLNRGKSGQS